jgi:hypothetical protein
MPLVYESFPKLRENSLGLCIFAFITLRTANTIYEIFGATVALASVMLNIWIGLMIYKKLQSFRSSMSTATYEMHKRCTQALLVQVDHKRP